MIRIYLYLLRITEGIRFRIRFWFFKHLKNGVVFVDESTSLENAYDKVRGGGYIFVKPSKNAIAIKKPKGL